MMQTLELPPGPAEGFDLGGNDETLARLNRYFAEFGDIYRVFAPGRGVYNYVINHPDDIKRVLLSNHRNYTKGEGMDRVKILLGNGIMTSEGDFWRRQRRMMQPSFHRRVIDQFSVLIREVNDKFAGRWAEKAARAEAVNLSDDTSELTLEIVLRSIFGRDLARLENQFGANPFEVRKIEALSCALRRTAHPTHASIGHRGEAPRDRPPDVAAAELIRVVEAVHEVDDEQRRAFAHAHPLAEALLLVDRGFTGHGVSLTPRTCDPGSS